MHKPINSVNPALLIWARESVGLTVQEVASNFGKMTTQATVEAWERGELGPTYPQLKKLAREVYKRPLAVFFFSDPPLVREDQISFRYFGIDETYPLDYDTRMAIRLSAWYQQNLEELFGGENEFLPDFTRRPTDFGVEDIEELASQVRTTLGIDAIQQSQWNSPDEALRHYRDKLADNGIFLFYRSIKQRDIAGFSISTQPFPVIMLNNTDQPDTRKIFTLFHELGHIAMGHDGLSFRSSSYIEGLPNPAKSREYSCNAFAAAVLIDKQIIMDQYRQSRSSLWNFLGEMSTQFKVSKEVILRRIRLLDLINPNEYQSSLQRIWDIYNSYTPSSGSKRGGHYYNKEFHYLGSAYIGKVMSLYHAGSVNLNNASQYLNMKPSSFGKAEQLFLQRMAL